VKTPRKAKAAHARGGPAKSKTKKQKQSSGEQLPADDLADIAARVREAHAKFVDALRGGMVRAIEAGELLIQAKAKLKHGEWLPWLADQCGVPERSAQLYMRVARHRDTYLDAKSAKVSDLGIGQAMRLLAKPKPKQYVTIKTVSQTRQIAVPYTAKEGPALRLVPPYTGTVPTGALSKPKPVDETGRPVETPAGEPPAHSGNDDREYVIRERAASIRAEIEVALSGLSRSEKKTLIARLRLVLTEIDGRVS
jgi:DUF3102 family protein